MGKKQTIKIDNINKMYRKIRKPIPPPEQEHKDKKKYTRKIKHKKKKGFNDE